MESGWSDQESYLLHVEDGMVPLILGCVAFVVIGVAAVAWVRRMQAKRLLERYTVDPDGLYVLLNPEQTVLVFDVRQPLDLLAHSEIIPGSVRIAPKEALENSDTLPKDRDMVIYCTCPGDKTSKSILVKVLALNFTRLKILRGGLEGWKAKGYPVERYDKAFRLDTESAK
jgi:rhodanese-related sulfurtransferase